MNVSVFLQVAYDNKSDPTLGENKPNSKPIQTQTNPISQKPKMNVNFFITKDYENKCLRSLPQNKPKTNPNKANFKNPLTQGDFQLRFSQIPILYRESEGNGNKGAEFRWY
jgi:hypothetical protein